MLDKAQFFWHGGRLGPQEWGCIRSFSVSGFHVDVFTYIAGLELPVGARVRDASEILPQEDLNKFTQNGEVGNLAAFSDAFRYHLLQRSPGWWFDADVLCRSDVGSFAKLVENSAMPELSLGSEDANGRINGAVLYVSNPAVAGSLLSKLEAVGTEFEWGAIGPKLLSEAVSEFRWTGAVAPRHAYYPVHYDEFFMLVDPARLLECESRCEGSLAVHLWSEMRRRFALPRNIMPPENSFLWNAFCRASPELKGVPALPVETLRVLMAYSSIADEYDRLVRIKKRIKSVPVPSFVWKALSRISV